MKLFMCLFLLTLFLCQCQEKELSYDEKVDLAKEFYSSHKATNFSDFGCVSISSMNPTRRIMTGSFMLNIVQGVVILEELVLLLTKVIQFILIYQQH